MSRKPHRRTAQLRTNPEVYERLSILLHLAVVQTQPNGEKIEPQIRGSLIRPVGYVFVLDYQGRAHLLWSTGWKVQCRARCSATMYIPEGLKFQWSEASHLISSHSLTLSLALSLSLSLSLSLCKPLSRMRKHPHPYTLTP